MPLPELKAVPLLELKPLPLPELDAMPSPRLEAMPFPLPSLAGHFPELEEPLAPPPSASICSYLVSHESLSLFIWSILIFLQVYIRLDPICW